MKKLLLVAAITVAAIAPARADYYVKDGQGNLKLFKAATLAGSVVLPYNALTDANGLPFGTTANPIALRFGTGVFLPDFSNPQHVICDSGCSGGGGGSSYTVTYGAPIGTLGTPTGFKDVSGNFQSLLGDTTNGQWVNIKASVPIAITNTAFGISGTLPAFAATPTFNIGTAPTITVNGSVSLTGTLPAFAATPTFNLGTLNGAATAANQAAVQGTVAGGTAAAASQLAGAVYNSTPLTLTNGQGAALQADANGYLRVNVMTGGGGSSAFGAAFPASGVALGMNQGGNLVGVTGTSGNLNVQCANCSGSGVSTADQATFTAGASLFAGAGGFFQTTATNNPLTNGQQGMFQVTANRALFTNLRNASGAELGVAAAPLQVSLANTGANGTAIAVSGPLTDTQLRASAVPVSISGNQATNIAQINGVTPLMGNGVTGTGSLRVTIASDNTAFSVNAVQSGTWNINSISTLPALTTGSNIIGRVGIDQTTPGTTNLVSIGTNGTVNPTTAANWGIGTSTQNSATVANGHLALGQFNTSPTTITSGNMSPLQLDASGNLKVNIITGASSGAVAQGSTTSGQTGLLMQGAVTTAAPSYTTAQTNPLSLTTTGNLRTVDGSLNTVSGTTADNACPSGTSTATMLGCLRSIAQSALGANPVNVNAVVTAQTGLTPGVAQTGTIIAANVDVSSIKGTATDVNSGNKSAGTQRVVVATDQPAIPAAGQGATGAAPPSGAQYMGANASGATGGLLAGLKTCDQHKVYDASDNGSIEMIPAVSGRTIYICGFIMATGGTATNLKLVDGTGTNCATGTPVNLTPAYQLAANDKIGAHSAFWTGLAATGTNRAVCINASAGNAHQAEIWYTIQ